MWLFFFVVGAEGVSCQGVVGSTKRQLERIDFPRGILPSSFWDLRKTSSLVR